MLTLESIRYMGNKAKLLDRILPEIGSVTPSSGTVCDIMAGSNAVSYALKENYTVYTNDVQQYSYAISKAIVENQSERISSDSAVKELTDGIEKNKSAKHYRFFEDVYSDTYFSRKQCADIDDIRYAVENVENEYRRYLYLFALMCAMCKVQSTPGHFAQFMPSTHSRIIPLQKMDLTAEFLKKCDELSDIYFSQRKNIAFCCDYKQLLKDGSLDGVDTVYLDSPYSQEQYSRFYHILETAVKYDYPQVDFKAKYRSDRFMSGFCYKSKAEEEFRTVFEYCRTHGTNLVISYSNAAVLPSDRLREICKEYFSDVKYQEIRYDHSTQGKGTRKISEVLLTCRK